MTVEVPIEYNLQEDGTIEVRAPAIVATASSVPGPIGAAPQPENLETFTKYVGYKPTRPNLSPSLMGGLDCWMRFLLAARYNLSKKSYASAREIGRMSHAMLDSLHKGGTEAEGLEAARKEANKVLCELVEDETFMQNRDLDTLQISLSKDLGVAQAMMRVYWKKYGLDPKRFHLVASELDVKVHVTGFESPWHGIMDYLVYDEEEKGVWILDCKTTRDKPMKRQATTAFDPATRMYRVLANAHIQTGQATYFIPPDEYVKVPKNTPVLGIVFVTIMRPTIRQKDKWSVPSVELCGKEYPMPIKGKTRPQSQVEFFEEIERYYEGTGEHTGTTTGGQASLPQPYWHRYDEPIFCWEFLSQMRIGEFMAKANPCRRLFLRTTNMHHCHGMTGGEPCQFLQLCSSDPRLWETIIQRDYTHNPEKGTLVPSEDE